MWSHVFLGHGVYALPSRGCFLTAGLSGKIDAFLRRAHRYGLATNILTVSELFNSVAQDFFQQNPIAWYCLHSVLPEKKTSSLALRPRGHQFQLPTCVYSLFKCSFVNHCLFKFVYSLQLFYAFTFVLCIEDLLTYLLTLILWRQ